MPAARVTAIIALVFVALSGLVGGIPLILHPCGEPWRMPQSLLQFSPFHSYLMPGIILFCAIGLLGTAVLWLTLTKRPGYAWWVALQGCVLLGWIVVEVLMLRLVGWPHWLYGGVALVLIVTGFLLLRRPHPKSESRS